MTGVSRWAQFALEDLEPATWSDCVNLLLSNGGPNVFYRGQPQYDWPLSCSLERSVLCHLDETNPEAAKALREGAIDEDLRSRVLILERRMLHRFQEMAESFGVRDLPPARDRVGWWELMQHHHAPTRLLDWTRSPFVALWFAFDDDGTTECDRALWVIHRDTLEGSLRSVLAKVNLEPDTDFIDAREWQNRFVSAAIEARTYVPVPVRPRHTLARAVAQQSELTAFANVPAAANFAAAFYPRFASRIRVRCGWKDDVISACTSLGYDRLSLFRDLDTLGSGLFRSMFGTEPKLSGPATSPGEHA
jgi:hypothetical protein